MSESISELLNSGLLLSASISTHLRQITVIGIISWQPTTVTRIHYQRIPLKWDLNLHPHSELCKDFQEFLFAVWGGVLVWQMTNGSISFSCAWEPAYVTMLMRCNGGNPACWHMVLRWLLLMIFICVVVIQCVVYLMLGQHVTGSWLCHIICLNYGIWNRTQHLTVGLKTPIRAGWSE